MPVTVNFTAIGTSWSLAFYEEVAGLHAVIMPLVRERIARFDQTYSRFRADSWLSSIGNPGTHVLPPDAGPLFAAYEMLGALSGGIITPLVGEILSASGYDKEYSLIEKPFTPLAQSAWSDVIRYAPPYITVTKPSHFDVGAIGKGYLIDIVAGLLSEYGIAEYSINAGGDICNRSNSGRMLRVGLEDPFVIPVAGTASISGNPGISGIQSVIGSYDLSSKSIAGSSGNRRRWGNGGRHHIINAVTGVSPEHISAVWVVANTTLIADALTTALFFMPPDTLASQYDFEYLIVRPDHSAEGSLLATDGFALF